MPVGIGNTYKAFMVVCLVMRNKRNVGGTLAITVISLLWDWGSGLNPSSTAVEFLCSPWVIVGFPLGSQASPTIQEHAKLTWSWANHEYALWWCWAFQVQQVQIQIRNLCTLSTLWLFILIWLVETKSSSGFVLVGPEIPNAKVVSCLLSTIYYTQLDLNSCH